MTSNTPYTLLSVFSLPGRKIGVACVCLARVFLALTCLAPVCLVLAGCARESVIHVPPRFARDARLVPPDRVLVLSDGARIPLRVWPAQGRERGILLALHGFNDSRDAWESAAPHFAAAGFALWAPDQRGFGAAPDRGGWAGSSRMVQDALEELALIRKEHPRAPVWLMGESMGGAVAVLAAEKAVGRPEAASLAGVVLLAPALWDVGLVGRGSAHFLATLSPEGAVSGRELPVHVVATDNPAALRRLYFDPLTLHVTRFRALRGLVDLMRQAAVVTGRLRMPALVVYGDRDQLVPPKAMADAWRRFPPDVRRDLIPGGRHLLLRDRRGRIVADDILSWLSASNDPLPSGGDLSAGVWAAENAARPGDAPASAAQPFPLLPAQLDRMTPK